MRREAEERIKADLDDKLVLLSGPRQCGKTTLAKSLYPDFDYLNHDIVGDRLRLRKLEWRRDVDLVIFDELHKMPKFKAWLKGVVDGEAKRPRQLVTGSARLDAFRRVGDSLAGRFLQHRMHPLDLWEIAQVEHGGKPDINAAETVLGRLMAHSGFPEPYLKQSDVAYRRWQQSHLDAILRQDLLELETVRNITSLETMVELMRDRTGAGVSYANLARDLERDPKTIKLWFDILERLFLVFRVTPYSKNIARSLLREPKFYFFDLCRTRDATGPRFENLVACALYKALHRAEDTQGYRTALHYLRTKDGQEIDFLVVIDGTPHTLIEAKWSDASVARAFSHYGPLFPGARKIQLVRNIDREYDDASGVMVRRASTFLAGLEFK